MLLRARSTGQEQYAVFEERLSGKTPQSIFQGLDGVQVEDIANASNALYGCFVDIVVPSSLCIADRLQNFADEGQFDATFTEAFD